MTFAWKNGGDIFSDTRLDDGLHSSVENNEPAGEKDLAKQWRIVVSMVQPALQSVENFTTLFLKLIDFVLGIIGLAETSNPEYMGPNNTKHTPFIYSVEQETFNNMARIAAGAFTNSLDKGGRRSLVGSGRTTPRLP